MKGQLRLCAQLVEMVRGFVVAADKDRRNRRNARTGVVLVKVADRLVLVGARHGDEVALVAHRLHIAAEQKQVYLEPVLLLERSNSVIDDIKLPVRASLHGDLARISHGDENCLPLRTFIVRRETLTANGGCKTAPPLSSSFKQLERGYSFITPPTMGEDSDAGPIPSTPASPAPLPIVQAMTAGTAPPAISRKLETILSLRLDQGEVRHCSLLCPTNDARSFFPRSKPCRVCCRLTLPRAAGSFAATLSVRRWRRAVATALNCLAACGMASRPSSATLSRSARHATTCSSCSIRRKHRRSS